MTGRRLAHVLAVMALLATVLVLPGRAVAARSGRSAPLTVTVDAMSPVTATDGTVLTLRGSIRVANGAKAPAQAGLRLVVGVGAPVTSREGLLRDFATAPGISRVLVDDCTDCVHGDIAQGTARYAATIPLHDELSVGLTTVFPLTVRLVGTGGDADGEADTFLPYVPSRPAGPLHVTWVLPLAPAPALAADGTVADSTFPASVDSGGSLAEILAATTPTTAHGSRTAPVTFAVDPALVSATTRTATAGWRRTGRSGTRPADTGSAEFLAALRTATVDQGVIALPYADTDATAVTRAGLGLDLSQALATGRQSLAAALPRAQVLSGVSWVPGNAVDQATLNTYAAAGTTTLVLPGGQLPATSTAFPATQTAVTSLPTSSATMRGLATDPDIETVLGTGGHDAPTARMAANRLLALLAVILGELPNDQKVRDVVLAVPRGTAVSPAWLRTALTDTGSASWLTTEPLAATAADPPGTRSVLTSYPASDRAAELPTAALTGPGGVVPLRDALASLAAALSPDTTLTRPLDSALLRAESYAWRADPAGGSALRTGVDAATRALLGEIHLAAAPTVTLGSRNASIPVTVENLLSQPVSVRVLLSATDRTKLRTTAQTVTVPAGRKERVLLAASTERAGTFRASVTLSTPAGLVISTDPITVHSHAYGGVSIGITVGAIAVLLVAVAYRTVQRIRRRGGPPAPTGGPPTPSAPAAPTASTPA